METPVIVELLSPLSQSWGNCGTNRISEGKRLAEKAKEDQDKARVDCVRNSGDKKANITQ